jgi:hypothetical protein
MSSPWAAMLILQVVPLMLFFNFWFVLEEAHSSCRKLTMLRFRNAREFPSAVSAGLFNSTYQR